MIPLARPLLGAREEELVLETLRSGNLSLGPRLSEFEEAFASWVGSDDAIAVFVEISRDLLYDATA